MKRTWMTALVLALVFTLPALAEMPKCEHAFRIFPALEGMTTVEADGQTETRLNYLVICENCEYRASAYAVVESEAEEAIAAAQIPALCEHLFRLEEGRDETVVQSAGDVHHETCLVQPAICVYCAHTVRAYRSLAVAEHTKILCGEAHFPFEKSHEFYYGCTDCDWRGTERIACSGPVDDCMHRQQQAAQ